MKDKSLGDIVNEVTIIRNNLKHPNIVRYFKTFKENDNLYIVMELIDGEPLSQHVRTLREKQETWNEEKIWNFFIFGRVSTKRGKLTQTWSQKSQSYQRYSHPKRYQ